VSYNKKIIITIFFFITILIAFFFYKILTVKFEYVPFKFDNIQCLIPAHFNTFSYSKNQWQGKSAFNHSKTHWIYIVRKNHLKSAPLEKYFDKEKKTKTLKFNNNLFFGIHAFGKNYRRYIYLFYHHNHAYWIESGASSSTLLIIKQVTDNILTSLKIDGKKPVSDLESTIKKTTAFVTPRYSQSFTFFLFILIGVLLLTYLIIIVIFYFSNKEPKKFIEKPLQYFKGITFKISLLPFGMQMYDGIIMSFRKELLLYSFRKPIIRINLESINDTTRIKIGRTFIFKQDYITFYFPEPIMVNIPGRKKSQRAKKITIYMDINKIQQLLQETNFHFKDQLMLRNYI